MTYKRPETTARVLASLAEVKPPRVYIASDGAKNAEDEEKVRQVRLLAKSLTWGCEVNTLFSDRNQGCREGVVAAIDWFFTHEKQGVILEDDTVPNSSFFRFCDDLLDRYSKDQRIGSIRGSNHVFRDFDESYCFSTNRASWGWATWRRAWRLNDDDFSWRHSSQRKDVIGRLSSTGKSEAHWLGAIAALEDKSVDTWDWGWQLSLVSQNMLSIFPKENLVSNIGFGEDATHTKGPPSKYLVAEKRLQFPLIHPLFVVPKIDFDEALERRYAHSLRHRMKKLLKKMLKKMLSKRGVLILKRIRNRLEQATSAGPSLKKP